jgi:uncharacterized membrane protein YhaH (DUF805 family)
VAVSASQQPSFVDAVTRGLHNLGDLRGRDTRAQFWPYAGTVVGSGMVIGNLVIIPVAVIGILHGAPRASNATTWILLGVTAVLIVTTIGLLAAAVTRRLRDRGLSGRWAGVPALLSLTAIIIFGLLTRSFDDDPSPALFLLGFANNVLYLVALIVLVIQLVLPGTAGDNRFGPGLGGLSVD